MLNVSTQSILNLTFSENINLSSGAIKLYKGNDRSNELIKTFEASPSSGIPTEIKVFENTAEIHLSGYLELSNQYYLLIDPDVFVDGAGNSYSGISRENQFNFSTPSVLLHQYEVGEEGAPVILAMGRGLMAEKIMQLANEKNINIFSSPLLARALYFTGQIGKEISEELYASVAAILAYIFKIEKGEFLEKPEIEIPSDLQFDEFGNKKVEDF